MKSPASSQNDDAARVGRERGRERRCVASGESLAEAQLIRFALGPDNLLVPDVAAKLPGRGAWVRADRASIERARTKNGFAHALKSSVNAPDDLADQTEARLVRRCLDFLGLARRGGSIAIGNTQVTDAIRKSPARVMIEASDGAEEGREKLMSLHIGLWGRAPVAVGCFDAADLGVALGRDRVIHACLLQERLASAWAAEIGRLAGFRAIVPGSWPDSWRSVSWGPTGVGGANAGPSGSGSRAERSDV